MSLVWYAVLGVLSKFAAQQHVHGDTSKHLHLGDTFLYINDITIEYSTWSDNSYIRNFDSNIQGSKYDIFPYYEHNNVNIPVLALIVFVH